MERKLCTRKMDELGRINFPQEAKNVLGNTKKQNVDIYIDENTVFLKANNDIPVCCLCGESEAQITEVGHALICNNCFTRIKEI